MKNNRDYEIEGLTCSLKDFNSNSCTVDLLKYIDEAALHDLASFAESQMVD